MTTRTIQASLLLQPEPVPDPRAYRAFSFLTAPDGIATSAMPRESSERRLARQVLRAGIRAACGTVDSANRSHGMRGGQVREARAWLFSDAIVPYSCRYLCEELGVDLGALRRMVTEQPAVIAARMAWGKADA